MILITGATDGIGMETARQLARLNQPLVVHGRSEQKLAQLRAQLLELAPNNQFHFVCADFSDLSQVRRMADSLTAQLPRLDVLINNAGVYLRQRELSAQGFEKTLAVNHLAHFLLTLALLPLLKKSPGPRVVTVSSIAHRNGHLDFTDMHATRAYDPYQAYANSKLANALFARELARRESWLCSNSLHPGVIDTKLLHTGFNMQGASLAQGAETSVYLAVADAGGKVSGKYFDRCVASQTADEVENPVLAERLWQWSAEAAEI